MCCPPVQSGAPGGLQALPLMRRNSSADRPDLREPAFSRCHVPLIWASPWHQAYGAPAGAELGLVPRCLPLPRGLT